MESGRAVRVPRAVKPEPKQAAVQPRIQAKLRVGAVDDPAEREADRVADEVTRWIEQGASGAVATAGVERDDVAARRVRRMASPAGAAGGAVDAELEGEIMRARRSGSPLPAATRATMDAGFGQDFSRVRIHSDSEADTLNRSVGARAFTLGNDVFFAKGEYQPGTADGRRLLAHELAHTVQQGGADVSRTVRRAEEEEKESEGSDTGAAIETASEEKEDEGEEEGVQLRGVIGAGEFEAPEVESTEAPGNMEADRIKAAGAGANRSPERTEAARQRAEQKADAEVYTVRLGDVGVNTKVSKANTMPDGERDATIEVNAQTTGSTAPGSVSKAFGSLSRGWRVFVPSYTVAKKGKQRTVTISATFDQSTTWGTTDGGRIDIASGTSPHVTADNYHDISDDLTPRPVEKSWVARRRVYWSKAICERHEKFHASDVKQWGDTQGKAFVADYLSKKAISITRKELRKHPDQVQAKINAAVSDARDALNAANTIYMRGEGNTYYSYPGEERAFGDGKAPYERLAAAVRKQGRALAKARRQAKRDEREAKKAGAGGSTEPTPTGSPTPATV